MYGLGVIILIETIYSNDNSDADRTSRSQTTLKMPKNIRQVGKSGGSKRIYIEDYVMTYLKQLTGEEYSGMNIAVLVGQSIRTESSRNIFISGAVKVDDIGSDNNIVFTNDIWSRVYEEIKQYFADGEIVGWYIGGPGYLLEEKDKIHKAHVDNFGGQDKVLLTYDSLEKEESFLCYESGRLNKQEGYYIYYEKNDEMQSYIIDHKKPAGSEAEYDDRVSREIRATIQRHTEDKVEESRNITRLMYAAGTLLAVVVLIVGAVMLRSFEQMKSMQDTLDTLTHNMQNYQGDSTEGNKDPDDKNSGKNGDQKAGTTPTPTQKPDKATGDNSSKGEKDGLDVVVEPGNVNPVKNANPTKAPTKVPTKVPTKAVKNTPTPKPVINYYVVKDGDTLADISYKLYKTYTKVNTIMQLNKITDQDKIKVGQKLIVP